MFKIISNIYLLLGIFLFETNENVVQSANILTIASVASHSHFLWHRILVKELVNRGHNVTLLTPDFDKNSENYTVIQMDGVHEKLAEQYLGVNLESLLKENSFTHMLFDWVLSQCQYAQSSNGIKKIMEYPKHLFDLIIIDVSDGPECYFPLIKKLGSPPLVGTSPFSLPPYTNAYTGDWIYPSIVPMYSVPYANNMSFFERFHNFLVTMYVIIYREYISIDQVIKQTRIFYGSDAKNSLEIRKSINVLLANINPISGFPQPHMPNVIPIGGLHIKLQENLPLDVKEFLDKNTEGVILFSLGSNLQASMIPPGKQKMLLEAFKQMPYKVLWKWESDCIENKPDNIMIKKWLPQCDVLNHPNVKLFITHSGELSTQEAIYYNKPVIGIPFFLDQHTNAKRMAHKGLGITLSFETLTSEKLVQAVNEIMVNPKYRQNMERYSKLFRDQPQTPMERGIFWIEYVLRHKQIPELQSASLHMPFYQKYCLDIIGTLLILVYVTIKITKIVIRCVYSLLFKRKHIKQKIK